MPVSHLLGEAVLAEAKPDELVLDMGTGSGVNAVLAATNGAHVVAVDINPKVLEAAAANAVRNGVADRVQVCPCRVLHVSGVLMPVRDASPGSSEGAS